MQVLEKILKEIEKLEKEHPYKVIGAPHTYGSYSEAWQDCIDRVEGIICAYMKNDGWIPVESEEKPPTTGYIYLSFANFNLPMIGRYEEEETGGTFYIGDDEESCISQDMIVNAWKPVDKPYRPMEEKHGERKI